MTTILPTARTSSDAIFEQLGQGLSQTLPQAAQQRSNREALQNSLASIKNMSNDPNSSPMDLTLATLQATAGIPGSERYVAQLIPMLQQMAAAKSAQNVPFGQGQSPPRNREPIEEINQRSPMPNFLGNQENQNFPSNVGPNDTPGNLPQAATEGQVKPLRTPAQRRAAAVQRAKEYTANGIPMTPKEALVEINDEERDTKDYNKEVEQERQNRIVSQEDYGNKAIAQLKRIYPDATPEMETIFQKKGEEAAFQGKSEGDINRFLATEAKNFKNTISNVKSDLSAPRTQNNLHRKFLQSSKDSEQAANDLRVKLKPLLDLGLYDTSRNLLSELGYYPEEREQTINPFGERLNVLMNKVPKSEKKIIAEDISGGRQTSIQAPLQYGANDLQNIKSGIKDLKNANPNFSLVLARKAFEDKNYDWRIYKDALNDMIQSGEIELEDDQQNQLKYLDTPPLNVLERILHGLNIIGR